MSEATDQLKAALPGLVHPELGPVMLVNFQTFPGQDDEQQAQIQTFSKTIAEAIEHTLDERGFAIVPKSRLAEAPKAGSYTQVTLHCKVCGGPMLTTTMSADGLISIPPREINPDCEARHGAA
ncbi:hypothetical protein I5J47_gp76 [Mycobacterium phage Arib1]|uniref:Uncharacterized protein n=3 Tax=Fishburnevirus TaxID=1983734 RepID=A0A514A5U6_9CAUD|nr:hypothetical protein I5J47_gp76 [Mycobacterium phage Arib1]YP_009965041.1 hypothetical protein I5J48_gp79 [Mycobacterium phage Majeke]AYQ99912.1 hypothetical protein PBI_MANGETHE_79 [Mycobacterium phage Mangethe]QDH48644.1 hypothetical protein SEA_TECHAGE_77 [Mycobacterium phage Techage]URP21062.1 hypothetical protein SEA_PHEGASUS_79 [Mycobacterium phage Phegasus]WNO26660.1 hypothetical protein SEA_JUNIORMINT_72 [Mycobacterium phage Juniormint]WRQ08468.1 hypothetical protein JDBV10_00300 [